jgi:hypothetical protein
MSIAIKFQPMKVAKAEMVINLETLDTAARSISTAGG